MVTVSAKAQEVPAARLYAIRELAVRAGVSAEFFRKWTFENEDAWTTVKLGSGVAGRIRFPSFAGQRELQQLKRSTGRATWANEPAWALREKVPDFIIPFVASAEDEREPVFAFSKDCVDFRWDLPSAALWTLSRAEEIVFADRDAHNRFPASASVAAQFDFLSRPIVDEYGFALEQALQCLLPAWQPERRSLRVKLSHDIDVVGIPFELRATTGHTLRRHAPSATISDVLSLFTKGTPAYLQAVERIARLSLEHQLDSAFYWKASGRGPYNSGYDPRHPKIWEVIASLLDRGFECGIHPGYDTFGSAEGVRAEIKILTDVFGQPPRGGRQHYLRWRPETWIHWEACGLSYDSTVGFADRIGFRAGTCIPYRPWILSENRQANLLEVPLIVMDLTLSDYMGLSAEKSFDLTCECIERARLVGGVFTLLWHNNSIYDPGFEDLYARVLKLLSGTPGFDGTATAEVR